MFQFFLELMKVPRVESKLRVFSFTITFSNQVFALVLVSEPMSMHSAIDFSIDCNILNCSGD